MAEDEKAEEKAAPAAGKGKSKKKLIIIIALAFILIGGGAGAYFVLKGKKGKPPVPASTTEQLKADAENAKADEEPKDAKEEKAGEEKAAEEKGGGEKGEKGKEGKEGGEKAEEENPLLVKMDPVTANLNEGNRLRMVTVKFVLEGRDKPAAKEVKKNLYRLTDAFITLLGNKTQAEVNSEPGKKLLKLEIQQRADEIVGKGKVVWVGWDQIVTFIP